MNIFLKTFKKYMVLSLILVGVFTMFLNTSDASFGIDPSIKQVKTTESPVVFYLDHERGFKKPYLSEKAYLSYGNEWSDVKIISKDTLDSFKTAYLLKTSNNPTVYYISDNKKIAISNENEFNANGYKWEDIVVISDEEIKTYVASEFMYYGGPDIEDYPSIKIGNNEPTSTYVPLNTNDNLVASYIISSPNKTIKLTELKVKMNGVFVSSDILKKAKLKVIGDSSSLAESDNPGRDIIFNLTRNPLVITAGNSKEVGVYLDLGFNTDISNQSFYATIEGTSNLTAGVVVKANYPLNGKTLSLVDGSQLFSNVKSTQVSLSNTPEVIIGNTKEYLSKVKFEDTLSRGDLVVEELVFKNSGTAEREDFNNFKIVDKYNKVISTTASIIDDLVTFKFSNYKIEKDDYADFKIYADIIGGEDNTIILSLDSAKVTNENYNYYLPVEISNLGETKTIVREDIAVLAHNIEINEEVFKNETGNLIGVFEIRSDNQEVKLKEAKFSLEKSSSAPSLEDNVFLVNYDNGDIIDSIDASKFSNSITTLDFNNYVLDSRNKLKLGLVSKVSKNASNGDTYKVILNELEYENLTGMNLVDPVNVSGDTLKVGRSNIYIYDNDEDGVLTSTKGDERIKIASFFLESSSGDDLVINSMAFVKSNGPGSVSYDNGFSNLKLYIGSRRLGNTIEKPYSNTHNFEGFSYTLRDGKRVEVNLYADIDKDLKVDNVQIALSHITAISKNAANLTNINNLNTNSYKAEFNTASASITNVAGGSINPGEDDNLVGSFKVENTGGEELKLKNIVVETSSDGFSYSRGYSYLAIKEKISGKRVGRVSRPVASSNEVSMGNYRILPGAIVEFDVYVDASESVGNGNYEIFFRDLEAIGRDSGVSASINGDSNKNSGTTNSSSNDGVSSDVNNGNSNSGTIDLLKPLTGSITYGFHDPDYPYRNITEHNAIDISAFQGTYVKASANGTVTQVINGGETGYSYIAISHENNFITVYGHLSELRVNIGDSVTVNDVIGRSGGTPGTSGAGTNTNGPHLHFEVWHNGVAVDPEDYL